MKSRKQKSYRDKLEDTDDPEVFFRVANKKHKDMVKKIVKSDDVQPYHLIQTMIELYHIRLRDNLAINLINYYHNDKMPT